MSKEIEGFVLLPIPVEPKTNEIFELAGQNQNPTISGLSVASV